jgi:hypothetical protein
MEDNRYGVVAAMVLLVVLVVDDVVLLFRNLFIIRFLLILRTAAPTSSTKRRWVGENKGLPPMIEPYCDFLLGGAGMKAPGGGCDGEEAAPFLEVSLVVRTTAVSAVMVAAAAIGVVVDEDSGTTIPPSATPNSPRRSANVKE